ncbi:response regulator transcription factor [Hydrogenovibrio sp. JE_KL2]|jgi:two-component system, OmpR family, response regulator|uniref:response regulator transcription factor n=1 Tax=Hydrogenovibrio sp. JE_KL2 TaxID=2651188 RepID=UPI0020A2F456|nr:response regulator transcription factor [Hydrogenovibrio sp. JE_KL2]
MAMLNNDYTITIVEDDPLQLENLGTALSEQGFKIKTFSDRASAESSFEESLPDLVISDIILGNEIDGGFELAKHLLSFETAIPVIFLSERQSEFDIYTGHALGAIDYLPKPISLGVLTAKVKNLLRITGSIQTNDEGDKSLIDGLVLANNEFKAYWHSQVLDLTATEFEMLKQFALTGEKGVVTYDKLQESTQGVVERNTINTHICRIRNAFKKVDNDFNLIHNEYGRGYSWRQK